MLKITKIEPQKRNPKRVSVYIDGYFALDVDMEIAYNYDLKEGKEIDADFIESVVKKEEQLRANNYALNLLSFRARSEKEIYDKMLQKGYEPSVIANTIQYLKEQQYINDKEFAETFIKDKVELSHYGRNRIKAELLKKGIDKELIDELIEATIQANEEYETAKELAKSKIKSYQKDKKDVQYRKLSGYLLRKGYSYDIVFKVAKELIDVPIEEL
jgi:regulatory protein